MLLFKRIKIRSFEVGLDFYESNFEGFGTDVDAGVPDKQARFRAQFRAEHIAPHYNGWAHFCGMVVLSLGVIAVILG